MKGGINTRALRSTHENEEAQLSEHRKVAKTHGDGRSGRRDDDQQHRCGSAHDTGVADAPAEGVVSGVVGEPLELLLDGRRQGRVVDVRVLRLLPRELRIKVRDIEHRFLKTQTVRTSSTSSHRRSTKHTTLGLNGGWIFLASKLRDRNISVKPLQTAPHKANALLTGSSLHTSRRTDVS